MNRRIDVHVYRAEPSIGQRLKGMLFDLALWLLFWLLLGGAFVALLVWLLRSLMGA